MLGFLANTVANKWSPTRPKLVNTHVDLTGRTIIITGSNVGLGLEAAKKFYALNPERLILAVRSINKGEEAKREILALGESKTRVEVWELDLASFDSVKRFAKRCEDSLERLDILLENAALISQDWTVTADGWEIQTQVNVISTFLLARLLFPMLEKTARLYPSNATPKPHLVIVASDAHFAAPFKVKSAPDIFAALNAQENFESGNRYSDTKLFDIMLTRQLAQSPRYKQEDTGVVICTVNPGWCRSELLRDLGSGPRAISYAVFAKTTEQGARTYTWACLNDVPSGSYTSSCRVEEPSRFVRSDHGTAIAEKLWKELSAILTKVEPSLMQE
ncbi:hypothetical protein FRC19_002095 [Serendipita sp. 401]|nr:hypothetical protein FRC19_002095 [Serendipita sp. 401]